MDAFNPKHKRVTRTEYWAFQMWYLIIVLIVAVIYILVPFQETADNIFLQIIKYTFYVAGIFSFFLFWKRIADAKISKWWLIIPLASIFVACIAMLAFFDTDSNTFVLVIVGCVIWTLITFLVATLCQSDTDNKYGVALYNEKNREPKFWIVYFVVAVIIYVGCLITYGFYSGSITGYVFLGR